MSKEGLEMRTTEYNTPRLHGSSRRRWFDEGELVCARQRCGRPMPAGFYGKKKRLFHCSVSCASNYYWAMKPPKVCQYCGKLFVRLSSAHTSPFCTKDHLYAWRRKQLNETKVKHFLPYLQGFLDDCAPRFYAPASFNQLRCNLAAFFGYLNQKKIRSLEKVTPSTISNFLIDLQKRRKKSAGRVVGEVRLFFDWLAINGKRKAANPVIPKFHTAVTSSRLPRPFSEEELKLILSLIEGSKSQVLKTAIAIGLESGLRISEVCNLRLSDLDMERQTLFVRLPTKTRVERLAPFHNRAKHELTLWLKTRPSVEHDYLLTGITGIPLRKHMLRSRLNTLLCGEGKLARFSFHRLRHTAASRVSPSMDAYSIMRTFGWTSERVMQNYAQLLPETLRNSYAKAMDRLDKEPDKLAPASEPLEAYFARQCKPEGA